MMPKSTDRGEVWVGNDPGIRKKLAPKRLEKRFPETALNPSNRGHPPWDRLATS
jgi:hypothetical protein